MFITLLTVTLLVSLICCAVVARIFDRPIRKILDRIVAEDLGSAWHRYVKFAIYVVGVSGGVKIHQLQTFVTGYGDAKPVALTSERWTLEVYRTVIETLGSLAWMLLVVFLIALVAFVILRGFELRARKATGQEERDD